MEEVAMLRKLSQRSAYTSMRLYESIGRKIGLPGTYHKYLGLLIQKGQMTVGELAVLTDLTTGAVIGLIDNFESNKLVKLYKDFQDSTYDVFSSFSTKALSTLETYFKKVLAMMEKKIEEVNQIK